MRCAGGRGMGGGESGEPRSESHGGPGSGADHVGAGEKDSMKLRGAVLRGGRSGEHEISLRSARSIMEAMDPSRYEVIPYTIGREGKWSPPPILPKPSGNADLDVV